MVKSVERAIDPEPARASWLLEQAINNLSLGLIIFDKKRRVVFCNKRYMEIYGLSSEQVKPGTPTSELIQHRLNLGLKVLSKPTTTSGSALEAPSFQARLSMNSRMAGSLRIPSIRCRTARNGHS